MRGEERSVDDLSTLCIAMAAAKAEGSGRGRRAPSAVGEAAGKAGARGQRACVCMFSMAQKKTGYVFLPAHNEYVFFLRIGPLSPLVGIGGFRSRQKAVSSGQGPAASAIAI